MDIHEYGEENPDILLMFHCACMSWKIFEESAAVLARCYHVVIPAFPGHDPEKDDDFTSVEDSATQVEDWLLIRGYDTVACLYGLSMGGGIALRMLADGRVGIRRAIVDGGITPYRLPRFLTRFIAVRDFILVKFLSKLSGKKALKLFFPPQKYSGEQMDRIFKAMLPAISNKTIWHVFDSTNNYSMPHPVPKIQTELAYWYGEKEKKARAWDMAYVKKNFPTVRFRELQGLSHAEYCVMHPRELAADLIAYGEHK